MTHEWVMTHSSEHIVLSDDVYVLPSLFSFVCSTILMPKTQSLCSGPWGLGHTQRSIKIGDIWVSGVIKCHTSPKLPPWALVGEKHELLLLRPQLIRIMFSSWPKLIVTDGANELSVAFRSISPSLPALLFITKGFRWQECPWEIGGQRKRQPRYLSSGSLPWMAPFPGPAVAPVRFHWVGFHLLLSDLSTWSPVTLSSLFISAAQGWCPSALADPWVSSPSCFGFQFF